MSDYPFGVSNSSGYVAASAVPTSAEWSVKPGALPQSTSLLIIMRMVNGPSNSSPLDLPDHATAIMTWGTLNHQWPIERDNC